MHVSTFYNFRFCRKERGNTCPTTHTRPQNLTPLILPPFLFRDGVVRQIVIPGSLRKKEWVSVSDILLISRRVGMTDDSVGDLMAKLYPEEIALLKQRGDISEAWQAGGGGEDGNEAGFVFSEGGDEEEDEEEIELTDL